MLTCREKHNGIAPRPQGARALRPARPTHIPLPPSMPSVLRTPPPARLASARPRARSARGGARPATAEMMMHASHRQTNNVVERSCWTTLKGCFDSRARFHTASESFVDEAHVLPTGERFGAQTTCDAFERDDHEVLVCACAPEPPRIVSMPRTNSPLARPASPPLFFFVFDLTLRRPSPDATSRRRLLRGRRVPHLGPVQRPARRRGGGPRGRVRVRVTRRVSVEGRRRVKRRTKTRRETVSKKTSYYSEASLARSKRARRRRRPPHLAGRWMFSPVHRCSRR